MSIQITILRENDQTVMGVRQSMAKAMTLVMFTFKLK